MPVGNVVPASLPELPHGHSQPSRSQARQRIHDAAVLVSWDLLKHLSTCEEPEDLYIGNKPNIP